MSKILDWNIYKEKAAQLAAEGAVLLENRNSALPLMGEVSVFGRMQLHYYKSGTGSGGLVNAPEVTGLLEGLENAGARINEELLEIYRKWDSENPVKTADGWGGEPWSQAEMPLDDAVVEKAAARSDTALAVIARTAGEEQENKAEKGSYLLTDEEEDMLRIIRKHFQKVAVVINAGNIIDMSFVKKYSPDAVMYIWHGGMTGGTGAAEVLTGLSPSGKLPDTIPLDIKDIPSDRNFGDPMKAVYAEDIFVGYRYFETFAPDKVLYPFGYGLSYTTFGIKADTEPSDSGFSVRVSVKNTGDTAGKEVVQVYVKAPSGKLGKAARVLCGFGKTKLLSPSEKETMTIKVPEYAYSSYDETGASGFESAYVLEAGTYEIYVGSDVRSAEKAGEFTLEKTKCVCRLTQALAPVAPFDRMTERDGKCVFEPVPLQKVSEDERRMAERPLSFPFTGDKGYKFTDVGDSCTMEDFVSQLTDRELCEMARGEGCGSPKVTPGTTSAFGGITEHLNKHYLIPVGCTSDGPSGLRFDCGTQAFSLPIGTLIAATFNTELTEELFGYTGLEVAYNKVDCLLGPGMNIHRHPLCGRNFEYFSEDPFLTGKMGAAELRGLTSAGVTGTIKHFCANNQEYGRHTIDSVVSERALREIYLKGFETAVKEGGATSVMTTYGRLNGTYTSAKYDLCTTVLRKEWGFEGFAMTDWWADTGLDENNKPVGAYCTAEMAAAGNDTYMVFADAEKASDDLESGLENGTVTRGELARNAMNILGFLKKSHAYERICGTKTDIELINRRETSQDDTEGLHYFEIKGGDGDIDVSWIDTSKGSTAIFVLDVEKTGLYDIVLTGSTELSEKAQSAVSVFSMGSHMGTFTFSGTEGRDVSFTASAPFFSRYTTLKLYFAQGGINLSSVRFVMKNAF